jgi:hypothetical protein
VRWQVLEMQQYLEQKEYIDTILIPLVPISWENALIPTVREGEFVETILKETERQLQGRVILLPPFTYLKNEDMEERMKRLAMWKTELNVGNHVKYVFFVTSDVDWKRVENELEGLVWAAPVPLEHMDERHRKDFVDENVGLIMKNITEIWGK